MISMFRAFCLTLATFAGTAHAQDWTYPPLRSPESVIRDQYNGDMALIQSLFAGVADDLADKIEASLAGATGMALLGATTAGGARSTLGLGSAALQATSAFAAAVHSHAIADVTGLQTALDGKATAAQGALADSAVQPGSLATVATTGSYLDLSNVPLTFAPAAHTQAASTITDFAEAVDDRTAALLVAGSNVTLTYNDGAGTLTIAASGGGSAPSFMQNRWTYAEFTNNGGVETPYVFAALSSGTTNTAATVFDPKHPGSVLMRDSTTANGGGHWAVATGLRGGAGLAGRIILSPRTTFADVTTRAGFHDSTTSSVTDGAYWDIETGTGVARAICRNNSTETVGGTTYALTLGTFYTMDVDYLTDSNVQFTLSDDSGARLMQTTITSNCPNTDARGFNWRVLSREGTVSAAADRIWLDYMGFGPARPDYAPVP